MSYHEKPNQMGHCSYSGINNRRDYDIQFSKKEQTLEEQMRHEQERIVEFLYQNYSLIDNQKNKCNRIC